MSETWNPWHGCHKVSAGCLNCFMYQRDAQFGKDSSMVYRTRQFNLPVRRGRNHNFRLLPEDRTVFVCLSSDFFIAEADPWRDEAWAMIRERSDLFFSIITKRPERIASQLPSDWGRGYDNVQVSCTAENQMEVDHRLPLFLELPIQHKSILHEPLLGPVNLRKILEKYSDKIEEVSAGGESGPGARLCDYAWIMEIMLQCVEYDVPFRFHQTGSCLRKGRNIYQIERKDQEAQARLAGIDYPSPLFAQCLEQSS
jgi:protein gp37